MAHKQVLFRSEAREKVLRGATTLADAIRVTVDGGVVVNEMRRRTGNHGFDAGRREYVDLLEAGIVDPTEVPEAKATKVSPLED